MNPDLDKAREGTQFAVGDGRKRGGDKAWSIRNQLRYAAAQNIDLAAEDAIKQLYGNKPTIAQQIAFKALQKTLESDMKAIEFADERIDGKLPQANINAELQAIQDMNGDQLEDLIRELTNKTTVSVGTSGEDEARGTDATASPEVQPIPESAA